MATQAPDTWNDRRKHRTNDVGTALSLMLEGCRRRARLEALAVSDEAGLLVAGAGPAAICEELAASAPLRSGRPSSTAGLRPVVHRMDVFGQAVLMCGLGVPPPTPELLREAAAGCLRILAA